MRQNRQAMPRLSLYMRDARQAREMRQPLRHSGPVLVAFHDGADRFVAAGGLAAADEALRVGGSRIWEAEHRRLRATFLAGLGASGDDVDDELARAALVARDQGAIGLERRVARTRSRLRWD